MSVAIIGAGVGGLTAALSLHAAGQGDILLLEAAREIRDVGVGINPNYSGANAGTYDALDVLSWSITRS